MRAAVGLFVVMTMLLSAGCSVLEVTTQAAFVRAPDYVYIQPDAKVGDKAVWKNFGRSHHIIIWEVADKTDDGFVVTLAWQDEFGKAVSGAGEPGVKRYFTVDKEGNIRKAKIKSTSFGLELPMRVAKSGTHEKREIITFATPQKVKTELGEFTVTQARVTKFNSLALDYQSYDLLSPDAAFGVVRSDQNISSDLVAVLEIYSQSIMSAMTAGADNLLLQNALDKTRSGGKVQVSYELVENHK